MFFYNIKRNAFIFLCILFTTYGCNKENKKIIVENKVIIETVKNRDTLPIINDISIAKKTQNEITKNKDSILKKLNNENVIFEFKSERLLQGRDHPKNLNKKQAEKALSAVLKMFKRNLSSNNPELYLKQNSNVSEFNTYVFEKNEISKYQNIIVFLPLTGQYSNFGKK